MFCSNLFSSTISINAFACVLFDEIKIDFTLEDTVFGIKQHFRACSSTSETFYCNYSSMYQCQNSSKCISKQRVLDGFQYCPFNDDEEEERIWCFTQYSSSIQMFDWILNTIHFFIPFMINCMSAIIVIIIAARTRSNAQKKKPFKEHLKEQLNEHKHLLISPLIIVLLSIPRIGISFLSGCMKSGRDSWFYLFGYFASFIPSNLTFIIFVLPSAVFKTQFQTRMKQLRRQ